MIPTLGFAFLLAVFSINIFLPFFNFYSIEKTKTADLQKINATLSYLSLLAIILSQICLTISFLLSDYSVSNVYQNSHHLKPFIYKLTGSWGNHEGSMILLILILSIYAAAINFFSKFDATKKIIINSTQSSVIALFAAFTAFTSNPFKRIFPVPSEGLSLNPLLQDIGLAMHPPMLYTGYLGFSVIFAFAIAALISEEINHKFAKLVKPWLFFAYGFLTLGIGLGAWWAYRELGWGGYWFWDPVENVSLMPWLAATILIHSLKILEKNDNYKIWTIFLAILTFILCLLGIFLTRSGILSSVHSFAIDAKRGFFIIFLITLIGGASLLLLGSKLHKIKSEKTKFHIILVNNYFLLIALFTIFIGTIYPILSRGILNQFIAIGPTYYNNIFSILILPFLVFLSIASKKQLDLRALSLALLLTGAAFFYRQRAEILQILILFLAIYSALLILFTRQKLIMTLAHFGFSLIIIGIVLTANFSIIKEINIKQRETLDLGNYKINFNKVEYVAGKNFLARQGDFVISKNNKEITTLQPQLRYYPISNQVTNEAAIKHGILGDLYLVIGNKDENENYALRAYFKPFIYLIWLGCLLIFVAALFGIKKNL